MKNKIISFIILIFIIKSGCYLTVNDESNQNINNATIEENPIQYAWQHAFIEYFNELPIERIKTIYINDINNNGIPDIIINDTMLLFYLNNEVTAWGCFTDISNAYFLADENKILVGYGRNHGYDFKIFAYDNNSMNYIETDMYTLFIRRTGDEIFHNGEQININADEFQAIYDNLKNTAMVFPSLTLQDINGCFYDYLLEKLFF